MAKKLTAIDAIHSMIHRKRMNNMVEHLALGIASVPQGIHHYVIKAHHPHNGLSTDTVPAMLTPHESVLNPNASEIAGRPAIDALNQIGNKLAASGVNLQHYATGTDDVRGGNVQHYWGGTSDAGAWGNPDFEPTPIPEFSPPPPSTTATGQNPPASIGDIPGGNVPLLPSGGGVSNYTPPMDIPLGMPVDFNFNNVADGSYRGPGSGYLTRNLIGLGAGIGANALIPGLGIVAGPMAKWLTSMLQHRFNNAMPTAPGQQQPSGNVGAPPPPNMPSQGFSPTGNVPVGREWWSKDFGRGLPSGAAGAGPGDFNPIGPMGGPGTAGIVGPGSPAGGGSFFGGHAGPMAFGLPGATSGLGSFGGGSLSGGIGSAIGKNILLHLIKSGQYTGPIFNALGSNNPQGTKQSTAAAMKSGS